MFHLNLCHKVKYVCDIRETLLAGDSCEIGIQHAPFLTLSGSRLSKISLRVSHYPRRIRSRYLDASAFKPREEHPGM